MAHPNESRLRGAAHCADGRRFAAFDLDERRPWDVIRSELASFPARNSPGIGVALGGMGC